MKIKTLATLGPVGRIKGGGTIASLLTLPAIIVIHAIANQVWVQLLITSIMAVIAFFIIFLALPLWQGEDDPSEIVLDEVIGCCISFTGIPITLKSLILAFLLFRFFDIYKIAGIHYCERLPHAWGILADDMYAGLVTAAIMHILPMTGLI